MTLAGYQMRLQRSNQRIADFDGATPQPIHDLEQACNERLRELIEKEISVAWPTDCRWKETPQREIRPALYRYGIALA